SMRGRGAESVWDKGSSRLEKPHGPTRNLGAGKTGMKKKVPRALGALLWLAAAAPAVTLAQDMFIYPRQDQSVEQQERDKWECRAWATNQTGFDPAARPRALTPPPIQQAPRGGALTGAAGGAGLGAIGGAVAGGNAGRGAA